MKKLGKSKRTSMCVGEGNMVLFSVVVGVAIGVAAFFTVVVVGAIYYYSRRYSLPRRPDEVVLVGDSGTSVA